MNSYTGHYIFASFGKIRSTLNNNIFSFAKNLLSSRLFASLSLPSTMPLPCPVVKKIPMTLFSQMAFSKCFKKLHHIFNFEFATLPITEHMLFWEGSCVGIKFFQESEDCILIPLIIVKHKQLVLNILVNKVCKSKEVEALLQRALCVSFTHRSVLWQS